MRKRPIGSTFSEIVASVVVLCLVSSAALPTSYSEAAQPALAAAEKPEQREDYYELLRLFVDTLDQVERNYVEDVTRRQLIESAINGMLAKLDQHSDYIAPEDLDRFRTGVEAQFGGVGIQVTHRAERLVVVSPLVGSPAYEAGVLAGDIITHIAGESAADFRVSDAIKRIKGPIGTTVKITVRHRSNGKRDEFELERRIIRVDTVLGDRRKEDDSWDFLYDADRKIGYVRVTGFARHTRRELKAALEQLKDAGMQGLIVDLRFNPGGLLSSAISISDMFIQKGRIVSTEGRNQEPKSWEATESGSYHDFPMAVLVNRFSASASEIVAACLQDHERAVVIGERTFGKGSVQNIVELEGGRSALKLTTAGYLRPNGKNIHRFPGASDEDEWGVRPNEGFEVVVTMAEHEGLMHYRQDRDIVGRNDEEPSGEADSENSGPDQAESNRDPDASEPDETVDAVLNKALEYIGDQIAGESHQELLSEQVEN